jgi:predicted transcriptional regulator
MRTKRTKQYLEDIARDENLRLSETQEITESFFKFVAQVMAEGDRKTMEFANIRVFKWGLFRVKEGRKKHYERINKKRSIIKSHRNRRANAEK